jgi:GMP synthase-like glutamine amidotransferase
MRVVVVRHHQEDSPGFIAEALEARGAELSTHLFPHDGPLPALAGVDHVVVLGAIPSVTDDLPWIAEELAWLRRADEAGVPILGICFGAQALCVVSGGRVETAPRKEIGWFAVNTVAPELVPPGPWLEFHGDLCLPPVAARILATTDLCVQAFAIGRHLGVQFHPEVDGPQLKRWLDAGAEAEVVGQGLDPGEFLTRTIAEECASRSRAAILVAAALQLATGLAGEAEEVEVEAEAEAMS